VDCESTGLTDDAIAVEVGWWDIDRDEGGHFIPPHNQQWVLDNAHPDALRINGYKARILGQPHDDGAEIRRLHFALRGQTIAGANVGGADCLWLAKMFRHAKMPTAPWNYRLGEIGPYAAGVLGRRLSDAPGLSELCSILGVEPEPEVHTAANGARVTGLCIRELEARRARLAELVAVA
jgi:hypothetical protein